VGDGEAFMPSAQRPVRVRSRNLGADEHLEPHRHDWGQLTYCESGAMQVTCNVPHPVTCIAPPSRAVWVPPGALHAVTVLEATQMRTLYIEAGAMAEGWCSSRVIRVSPLLRELIGALDETQSLGAVRHRREHSLSILVLDEMQHADTQALGVPLPDPVNGDKRLRALCEAIMRAPAGRSTLAQWACDIGASERTLARLFREQLGLSYPQWRQQVVLAHALPLLAKGLPVSHVAAAAGYSSDSAFSAMFKAAMGQSPSAFRA
jgi:AraC-like DNA-binding protein